LTALSNPGPFALSPGDLASRGVRALPVLAAAFAGFGIVMGVAANWDTFGKFGRFGLVAAVVAMAALAGGLTPRWRPAASLVGVLGIGALLALFGQTYQTGADPWQLFALWAALALPWVIAARHDAVWSVWVVVAFAALSLRLHAQVDFANLTFAVAAAAWLGGLAVIMAAAPLGAGVAALRGETRWAFRLAVLLWLALVGGPLIGHVLGTKSPLGLTAFGMSLLGVVGAGLIRHRPLELGLLAALVLTVDLLAIALFARDMTRASLDLLGVFVVAGGIIAGSATALVAFARCREVLPAASEADRRTWPITLLSGVGALITAAPALGFFFTIFGDALRHGVGLYLIGGLILAGALILIARTGGLGFAQQLGFIGLVVAGVTLGLGLYRDLAIAPASLAMLTVVVGTALVVPAAWIRGALGLAAALFATIVLADLIGTGRSRMPVPEPAAFRFVCIVVALAGVAGLFGCAGRRDAGPQARAARTFDRLRPVVEGWLVASLLGLMAAAGMTFLLGATLTPGTTRLGIADGFAHLQRLAEVLSVAAGLGAVALTIDRRTALADPAVAGAAGVAVLLSLIMPLLGPALLAGAVAARADRRGMAGLAMIAALWIVGAFYYGLGWPLVQKAHLMLAIGAGLAVAAWWHGHRLPHTMAAAGEPRRGRAAPALIALSALATLGLNVQAIRQKEDLLANGRQVHVALLPVDPRSLMQGDYMALRFALPAGAEIQPAAQAANRYAVGTIDARGVAALKHLAASPRVGTGEIAFALNRKHGRWMLGTDAWYFKEGSARTYEAARYGTFRVGADGASLLVGLADQELKALR
jgi:uncharacterized membrane-anchored protein